MWYSPVLNPLLHGQAGILDELLLFGAPLVVVIIILVVATKRSRKNPARQRSPRDGTDQPTQTPRD